MKVLLNLPREFAYDKWIPCEGIKLVETADGSFDLIVTGDPAQMREADKRAADLLARMKESAA